MNLLLDTHVFLWWLEDHPRLARATRNAIADPGTEVFVSAASIWEIAIKVSLGRLSWPARHSLDGSIGTCGFSELPISAVHASAVRDLPLHHPDPFDRVLIAQAACEALRVVTADPKFAAYGVPLLPA